MRVCGVWALYWALIPSMGVPTHMYVTRAPTHANHYCDAGCIFASVEAGKGCEREKGKEKERG